MKEIISERLSQIIKTLGINKNRLALELNYKNSVVGNVVNQRNLPSFDFIFRLKQYEPRLNLNWFISGEGNMFIDENNDNNTENNNNGYGGGNNGNGGNGGNDANNGNNENNNDSGMDNGGNNDGGDSGNNGDSGTPDNGE